MITRQSFDLSGMTNRQKHWMCWVDCRRVEQKTKRNPPLHIQHPSHPVLGMILHPSRSIREYHQYVQVPVDAFPSEPKRMHQNLSLSSVRKCTSRRCSSSSSAATYTLAPFETSSELGTGEKRTSRVVLIGNIVTVWIFLVISKPSL